jgi:peptidoglycan/LPS O-acetylase OafA/YrhL
MAGAFSDYGSQGRAGGPPEVRAPDQGRMHALDLLRGGCAIGVAVYHLLNWQSLARLDAIGLYAVYVFFALSGASITFAYVRKVRTLDDFAAFIALRFVRLAPLYIAVLVVAMAYRFVARDSEAVVLKLTALWSNLTMLFGLGNPGSTSLVIGGWSLGIEFLFYLLFPVFLLFLRSGASSTARMVCLLGGAFAVQVSFVHGVLDLGQANFPDRVFAYTQFSAFIAYFSGGCVVGAWLRSSSLREWPVWTWVPALLLFFCLFRDSGQSQSELLTGWQGGGRAVLTVLVVAAWSRLPTSGIIRSVAKRLGDASYGLYLLHPVIFYAVTAMGFASIGRAFLPAREHGFALAIVVIAVSLLVAMLFHHFVEKPLLTRSRARFTLGAG